MKTKAIRGALLTGMLMMTSILAWSAGPYFRLIPDSVHIYTFNRETNNMAISGINYNYYSDGLPDSIISTNGERIPVAKTTYLYIDRFLTEINSFVAGENGWVPTQHQELIYDYMNNQARMVVTRWRIDHWENLNTFTSTYDIFNRLIVHNREFWTGSWTDYAADSLFYNEDGLLIERSGRLKSTGQFITRMLYKYNFSAKKISQTRQDYLNNEWVNVNRTHFLYNSCGTQIVSLTEKWIDGSWQSDSRTKAFYHYELTSGARKVPVCHNGQTIYVMVKDLESHLAHGDCIGECAPAVPGPDPKAGKVENINKVLPFIVYPNPVSERVTIRVLDPDCPISRIELMDYSGRLLQVVNPVDQNEITLNLTSLKSGNYILRLTSDMMYSTVITKK